MSSLTMSAAENDETFPDYVCLVKDSKDDEQPSLFTPDQLATLTSDANQLIGGLISPLSGNLYLQQNDFTVIGAQDIPVNRIYVAPYMPHLFNKHFDRDCYYRRCYLLRNYEGWKFFPHVRLWYDKGKNEVHLINPNGAAYDFSLSDGKTTLLHPYAVNNVGGQDIPCGRYDPNLGRWLTTDPAGFTDSLNLYQFAYNNPFSYYDPNGEFLFMACIPFALLFTPAAIQICVDAVAVGVGCWGLYKSTQYAADTFGSPYTFSEDGFHTLISSWRNSDIYAPDRPLPRDDYGVPVPDTDAPHSQLGTRTGSKGKYPQAREFDKDGKPVRDIDFTDHGRPQEHTNPHQHKYKDNETGGTPERSNPEPVPEWEYE